MITNQLEDGHGTDNRAKVGDEGEQYVVVHPHPPKNEEDSLIPLRQYFTLDNDGVTNDMRVDGSVTEQVFSINADAGDKAQDTYIARMSFIIADAGATLNNFGNIGALANGVEIRWVTDAFGTVVVADALTSNFDFVRLGSGTPPVGDTTNAFRANNVVGTAEGYIPFVDFTQLFGIQWGFRLRHGSNDRIEIVIKDDVTGVDGFDCIAYGSKF